MPSNAQVCVCPSSSGTLLCLSFHFLRLDLGLHSFSYRLRAVPTFAPPLGWVLRCLDRMQILVGLKTVVTYQYSKVLPEVAETAFLHTYRPRCNCCSLSLLDDQVPWTVELFNIPKILHTMGCYFYCNE